MMFKCDFGVSTPSFSVFLFSSQFIMHSKMNFVQKALVSIPQIYGVISEIKFYLVIREQLSLTLTLSLCVYVCGALTEMAFIKMP